MICSFVLIYMCNVCYWSKLKWCHGCIYIYIYSIGCFKVCMPWLEYAKICLGVVQPVNLCF